MATVQRELCVGNNPLICYSNLRADSKKIKVMVINGTAECFSFVYLVSILFFLIAILVLLLVSKLQNTIAGNS